MSKAPAYWTSGESGPIVCREVRRIVDAEDRVSFAPNWLLVGPRAGAERGRAAQVLALLLLLFGCSTAALGGDSKPNIILIVSDDAGYNSFGFTGALTGQTNSFQTPNLDALAQQSIVARQGYVSAPVCSPSRAGLLTGLQGQRFGYETNISSQYANNNFGLSPDQKIIPQHLKELGYTTGMIGKWHQGYTDGFNRPPDMGFDEFFGFLGGGRHYWTDVTQANAIRRGDTIIEAEYRAGGDPSKYDPANGRYLTDALGEEAVDFIDRHAGAEEPFFLYLAYTSPHTPLQAKQADLAHFAHIADPTHRTLAAMNYAMDRSIGEVLDAVSANGIDDNTIVVFFNDNGGPIFPGVGHFNEPFREHKGTFWDGGVRVPFMIHGPGLEPGVFDAPISTLDLLPTFVAAAGGDTSELELDGVDLLPYLSGQQQGVPHETLFWRAHDAWAVRKGDWKLTRPLTNLAVRLYNLALDHTETINYINSQPQIVAELYHELTVWEAQSEKLGWGSLGADDKNDFDHFVFRTDGVTNGNWSTANAWTETGTSNVATFSAYDAYANAVLEFGTKNDGSYIATNNLTRMSGQLVMLNGLRLAGNFSGLADQQGTTAGNGVLLVKSLHGALPTIRLDAVANGTAASFAFDIKNEVQLFHDLIITGDGTQDFTISGAIHDYYQPVFPSLRTPHSVTKTGSSEVTLTGNSSFGGTLSVAEGMVRIAGPTAAINGAAGVVIGSGGSLALDEGTISVPTLNIAPGGEFQFQGGTLRVVDVVGDLVNNGGEYSPGASPAHSTIDGDFTQNAGSLLIEIGGTNAGSQFDSLTISGAASLGGTLEVALINGFVPSFGQKFEFLEAADGIEGVFANATLPELTGQSWSIQYGAQHVALIVGLPGDYNQDGTVDAADYTVWRSSLGANVPIGNGADGNRDGKVDQLDYAIWKSNFGAVGISGNGSGSSSAVPEPTSLVLVCLALAAASFRRTRRRAC